MDLALSPWRPLTPAEIGQTPDCPAVFELATLVRTVLFIGAAPDGLRAALNHHVGVPRTLHANVGSVYFRWGAVDDPEQFQLDLLEAYRHRHDGALPPAQSVSPPPQRPRRHLKAV